MRSWLALLLAVTLSFGCSDDGDSKDAGVTDSKSGDSTEKPDATEDAAEDTSTEDTSLKDGPAKDTSTKDMAKDAEPDTCQPIPPCNWCGGNELHGTDGCVVGFECANGADPCQVQPCSLDPQACKADETCGTDDLCWPDTGDSFACGALATCVKATHYCEKTTPGQCGGEPVPDSGVCPPNCATSSCGSGPPICLCMSYSCTPLPTGCGACSCIPGVGGGGLCSGNTQTGITVEWMAP